jgi:hypothetical protein
MKPYVIAIAALGLVGTIGTANADPLTAGSIDIWNETTATSPANVVSNALEQQGLPNATAEFSGASGLTEVSSPTGPASYSGSIEYHTVDPNTTIGDFLASDGSSLPTNCASGSGCANDTISLTNYGQATVMEFTFTVATAGTLLITHDDGVSVFAAGNEGTWGITNDLYNIQFGVSAAEDEAAPQTTAANLPDTLSLTAGTYDLWYSEVNGLPATLDTTFTPSVPAPPIGRGLPVLLAAGGILFGAKLWDRGKRRSSLGPAALKAA